MLTHQFFYRKFGVRLAQQLILPNTFELSQLELPVKSILHYANNDATENGPANDYFVFRNVKKPIYVNHITDLISSATLGMPRKLAVNSASFIRDFHNENRRFKLTRNTSLIVKDPTTLLVNNYSIISKQYKYTRSFFTEYYKWKNVFSTMVHHIKDALTQYDHQHYIVLKTPQVIPSLQQLILAGKIELTQSLMKVFNNEDAFMLLELWKFISSDKVDSSLENLPKNKIHLINLIYQENGRWCVLNLGHLISFRKNKADDGYVITSNTTLDELQLQKRFLKFNMSVMQLRTITADTTVEDTDEKKSSVLSGNVKESSDNESDALDYGDDENTEPVKADTLEGTIIEDIDPEQDNTDAVNEDRSDLTDKELKAILEKEDQLLDQDLQMLNDIATKKENSDTQVDQSLKDIVDEPEKELDQYITDICDKLADDGLISAAEFKRYKTLASSYKQIPSKDGKGSLEEYIKIDPQLLKITGYSSVPDSNQVADKTMLQSSMLDFDSRYVKDILSRDVAASVMSVQKAGIAVTSYRVEEIDDVLGAYENHTLKLNPIEGVQSVVHFKLPKIEQDGTFRANNVKYIIRKQRGDLPIRKTSYNRVALTSYYGKTFINRSKKKSQDYTYWLQTSIMTKGLDKEDKNITNIVPSNVHNGLIKMPRAYSSVSMAFKSFSARGFHLDFDRTHVLKTYPKDILSKFDSEKSFVFGYNDQNQYVVIDHYNSVYITQGDSIKPFGSFEEFLNLPITEIPVDYCEVVIYGKDVPVGVVLGYKLGLSKLLSILKVQPRRVQAGSRVNLTENEYTIVFSDETLVFNKDNDLANLILSGFNQYHKTIRQFSVYSFDKKGVYLNLLESAQLGSRYLREIDLMFSMFVDPITRDLLIEMKEPVTFQGLLFRACQMLASDDHPDELDPKYMRIKGYERLSGAVYAELIQSIRTHNGKLGKKNYKIELNPYAIWRRIAEDPSKGQVSEINPIKSLKEAEAVTFAGEGGRNKRSMTATTRAYHKNDMGTISESTVDSSDVGINIFTSANPRFTSLRGISADFDFKRDGATSLMSTSALLAPGSNRDDPKRVNFVAIQNEHTIACDGYKPALVRTGYENVVAHRSSDLFAFTAKKPGVVQQINNHGIIIAYDDSEVVGYKTGRIFGNAAGLTIPHEITTNLKLGDKIEVGDAIIYNTGFFEVDVFNPKRVVYKTNMSVKTVLWESHQTLEDSCALSKKIAGNLSTKITKVKTVVLNFEQSISKIVKKGDLVENDSVLCIIEDSVTVNAKVFDEQSIETLKTLGAQTPKAHCKGVIERIEVYYYGDKDDMSDSLKALVKEYDKRLKDEAGSINKTVYTGSVDGGFRIEGDSLTMDTMAIRFYITQNAPAGVGDKVVFANQMKSVTGSILDGQYVSESGIEIDAVFGAKSLADRIVVSPFIIGTTSTLLKLISKKAVQLYKS